MANANNEIFYDDDYIETINVSLNTIEENTIYINNAIDSINQLLKGNNMSGVEMILKNDITSLQKYFNTEHKNMIDKAEKQIKYLSKSLELLDQSGSKDVF